MQDNKNNNFRLLLLIIGLVILIGGAYLLYGGLSDKVEHNQLSSQGNVVKEEADSTDEQTADGDQSDSEEASEEQEEEEAEKMQAPDITVFDADGNEVKLSDFQGSPVILNFWASWCGPCKSEMPDFNTAYLQYGARIHFVMVNMTDGYSETQEKAQQLIDEQGYVFPVYFDLKHEAEMSYRVTSIPTTYFLDAEGNFVAQASGALDAATLQKGIDMLIE